jgi:hypothetical protein
VHTQSKPQRRRKSFFISAVHYYIIPGCRQLQLTLMREITFEWRPSRSSSSRAFRRARSRAASMPACASSRARERGQESIRELAGLVRGPACHPAKGSVLSTRRSPKARVPAICTSMATERPWHLSTASLQRREQAWFPFDARCPAIAWPHTCGRVLVLMRARSAGAPEVNPTAQRPRSSSYHVQNRLPLRRVSGQRPRSHPAGLQRQ